MKVSIGKYRKNKDRKVSVEITSADTWSLDHTLAEVIYPSLIKFKKDQNGSFYIKDKHVPKELRSYVPLMEENFDVSKAKYEYVLNEMIFAFGSKLRDWEEDFESGVWDMALERESNNKNGLSPLCMLEGPNHTYTIDKKALKKCRKRIENGFLLFGKYYERLWI